MRPNVQATKDPLNPAALPPTRGMEFDHRPAGYAEDSAWTCRFVVTTLVVGAIVAIVIRTLGHYVDTPFVLANLVLIGVLYAVRVYVIERRSAPQAIFFVVCGPLIWLTIWGMHASTLMLLFIPVLFGAVVLAHNLTRHFTMWMHAHPALDRTTRQWCLMQWGMRSDDPARLDQERLDELRPHERLERAEAANYRRGFVVVAGALVLALAVYAWLSSPLFAGMGAFAIFAVTLAAYGYWNAATYEPRQSTWRQQASILWRAIVSWCQYRGEHIRAPGVFRSPAGRQADRYLLASAVTFATALTVLPAASYFPIVMLLSGPAPWSSVEYEPWPWERIQRALSEEDQEPRQPARVELNAAQRAYAARLSPAGREAYIESLRPHATPPTPIDPSERLRSYQSLTASPERWFLFALRGALAGKTLFVWAPIVSLIVSLAAPATILFLTLYAIAGRRLLHHHATLESPEALYQRPELRSNSWKASVDRLRDSQFETQDEDGQKVRERDHLFIGYSVENDYPVLLSDRVLHEHAHIIGDSGSGKTSLGITPLMAQLIARGDASVLVLDLKGDMSLFQAARLGAEESNMPFRWFTNVAGQSSYLFNPFLQRHLRGMPRQQRAELFIQSLGLDYGEGYGTHYFSSVHREVLLKVMQERPEVDSFSKLARQFDKKSLSLLGDQIPGKQRDDATHLYAVVNALASIPALNAVPPEHSPEDVHKLDVSDLREHPQVMYFSLPAMLDSASVRQIAKLAMYCLLTAAAQVRGRRVYVIIDEFQQVVSQNLEIVLRQARSMDVACILANQTLSDLQTSAANLIPVVQSNTRFKQVFGSSDLLQQRAMIDASGEAAYQTISTSYITSSDFAVSGVGDGHERLPPELRSIYGPDRTQLNVNEVFGPRLRQNDIISASDDPHLSYVHIGRGHGFSQFGGFPFIVWSDYHIDPGTYTDRMTMGWPPAGEGAVVLENGLAQLMESKSSSPKRDAPDQSHPAEVKVRKRQPRQRQGKKNFDGPNLGDRLDAL